MFGVSCGFVDVDFTPVRRWHSQRLLEGRESESAEQSTIEPSQLRGQIDRDVTGQTESSINLRIRNHRVADFPGSYDQLPSVNQAPTERSVDRWNETDDLSQQNHATCKSSGHCRADRNQDQGKDQDD